MTKTYKLLIESPEYPRGTQAIQDGRYENKSWYTIYFKQDSEIVFDKHLSVDQVENRPEVWELQEDKLDLRSPEAEKMREESRESRFDFVPKYDEIVFCYDMEERKVFSVDYTDAYLMEWNAGFIKRTAEICKTHGEKYARYFFTE